MSILIQAAKIATLNTKGKGHISAYDAVFHALAIEKKADLVTADKVHFEKTKDLVGSVILLHNFYKLNI